jgi:4a-hydroxytetrahydrobiopterin dehydratase
MDLTQKHCKPCEGGVSPLNDRDEEEYLKNLSSWSIDREKIHRIRRSYSLGNFREAIAFVNSVAGIAEEEGHHPDITIHYNEVVIELYTHAISGLSENDFIVAAKIDALKNNLVP